MKMSEAFPSNFLKASDLQGRTIKVSIERLEMDKIGDDVKPVIYFRGKQKGMVLNKTNAGILAAKFGDESDGWAGKEIELYEDMVQFQGQIVPALRCRVIAPRAEDFDDEVGF